MNEFSYLTEAWREDEPTPDLLQLALRLATTPYGPLYKHRISPDRELGRPGRGRNSSTSLSRAFAHDDDGRVLRPPN